MKKKLLLLFSFLFLAAAYIVPRFTSYHLPICIKQSSKKVAAENSRITTKAHKLLSFVQANHYNSQYGFIIDMKEHSGRNRFFVYDFNKDSIVTKALVAHGSCNETYLSKAKFDNTVGSGCSSLGMYKVGESYNGRFGKAFKLYGLNESNSNAYDRNVVLHGYSCVPSGEIYPQPICNSLGCPMVSYSFLKQLNTYIKKSDKKIILWIID